MHFESDEEERSFLFESSRYDPMDVASSGSSSDHMSSSNFTDNDTELWEEFIKFQNTWNSLIIIYTPLETAVLSLGLIGNILAFATLIRSQNLCTPTFIYHRVLVFADLLFCINYFFNLFIDKIMTLDDYSQFVFGNWFAAYYSGVIYHAVHTTCTYVILYMTIAIAFERFMALLLFRQYGRFNEHWVARLVVTICTLMSALVHSWAPWFQHQVVEYESGTNNNSKIYTWVKRQHINSDFIWAKDIYNVILRVAFPVIISFLTAGVIYGFVRRQKHISERYSHSPTTTYQQRSRYEKTLFFFMIAVIILALIQVGAAESRRILQLIYPPGEISSKKISNLDLPISERLFYFRILLYGFQVSRIVSNLCTAVNHSFIGYLYVLMNNLFRRELLALLCCRPAAPSGLIRARTNSYGLKNGYHYQNIAPKNGYNLVLKKDGPLRSDSKESRHTAF